MKSWRPELNEGYYQICCYVKTGRGGLSPTECIFTKIAARLYSNKRDAAKVARKIHKLLKKE